MPAIDLVSRDGEKAYESLIYGLSRDSAKQVLIFKTGYALTNGVYHLRASGETNDLAELKVSGLR
ncbi:MAG TPA: hypothetical protein VL361_07060 [Candidatus Limnocylindrales bacterium]|nr:hypothetical protein [Candidatus Limnocylindrales bacterium]